MKCPICHATKSNLFCTSPHDLEYFVTRQVACEIRRCEDCQSLFQYPQPTLSEANQFYTADYQNYFKKDGGLLKSIATFFLNRAAKGFLAHLDNSNSLNILDYGCGQGHFLNALSELSNHRLFGYDVVLPKEANAAIHYSSQLQTFADLNIKFDIIRLNHVIEHLCDLDQTMQILQQLLKPTGKIVGQTPNGAHYTSNIFGRFWGPLHFPYHVFLFSEEGLRKSALRWNLKLHHIKPTIQPTGWSMSFENILKRLIQSKRMGRLAVYSGLLAISLPFVVIDRMFSIVYGSTAVFDFELKQVEKI